MPVSGISVTDDLIEAYNAMKKGKKTHYIKYAIENEALIIKETKTIDDEFDIKTDIPGIFDTEECCYVVLDLKWGSDSSGNKQKLVFISWAPDNAKVKAKMLHSSSDELLKSKLEGLGAKVQANDASEVTYEAVLEAAKQYMTSK
ncbi:uncharacterized protein [Apostichopus japonicus]